MKEEQESFHAIYETHSSMVFNLCLQYVQNREDAEDITQEVFVKIYQHLNRFDETTASLKTWIYRIAINQSLDFLKSRKAKKRFGFISSLFHPESGEPVVEAAHFNHPGVAVEDKEALQRVFAVINTLPESQRTALILARLEGRGQQEIAAIMNTSVKAVESLLQRAKQTLQKKLPGREG